MAAGNQVAEKGEQVMHLLQGQSLFSGSGSTPVQPSKPLVPQPSSSSQQKVFLRSPPSSSKQVLQMPSPTDNSNQGQVHPISSGNAQQPVLPLGMPPHQQQSLHRQASQSQQTIRRMLPQNRQASSDYSIGQVNQLPVNDTFHMSTSTDSTSVVPVTSSSAPPQWKAQEPFYDASTPNAASQLASIGNPSLPSSSGDEPITLHSQGNKPKAVLRFASPHRCDAVYRLKLDTPKRLNQLWGEV
ncbi:hypothetical protein IFM89_025574 [Coptis chinensis]|uniref:Uncharacterized protein n=1 Tax=Coptis chinensis TaxID=261450 RepID=A0A835IRJ3_9MAGN|nr:hypothetical protein IFM89_025574 [Coptis chinensis]